MDGARQRLLPVEHVWVGVGAQLRGRLVTEARGLGLGLTAEVRSKTGSCEQEVGMKVCVKELM